MTHSINRRALFASTAVAIAVASTGALSTELTSQSDILASLTPDERIEAGIEVIKLAMSEKYPGQHIIIANTSFSDIHSVAVKTNKFFDGSEIAGVVARHPKDI